MAVAGSMVLLVWLLAGCGGTKEEATTPPTTAASAAPQDFSGPGPYAAGVTRLATSSGQPVNVFYPADRAAIPASAAAFVYHPEDTLGPIASVLPPGIASDVTVPDAWVDVPASTSGRFPLVVSSHGRGGTRFSQSSHFAHLASWGFVVAAVEHPSRDLQARLGRKDVGTSDVVAVNEAIALLDTQNGSTGLSRTGPDIQLAEDGCLPPDTPAEQIQAVWNHLDTAQLRWAFGIDPTVAEASLQRPYLDATFPGTIAEYQDVP
ncbi:MAG: hypothetical protein R2726_05220 [Acidimicrobiales bacterium]